MDDQLTFTLTQGEADDLRIRLRSLIILCEFIEGDATHREKRLYGRVIQSELRRILGCIHADAKPGEDWNGGVTF